MKMDSIVFRGVQVAIVFAIVLIVGVVVFFLVTTNVNTKAVDAERKAQITRMQATARTYFARLNYFDGVCDAVGVGEEQTCNDEERGYAIATQLTDGTYYCADSTNFRGVIRTPLGTSIQCN